jgi:hypothetical protein
MYSSLLKVDIVAKSPNGTMYVQTDHRTRDEIASEPEISTLFALTRLLNARHHAITTGDATPIVVYACMDEPTPELTEALAAAGATLDTKGGESQKKLEPVAATPSELADAAMRDLVKRVQARVGLTDLAGTLHALEAETLADPPDVEEDEIAYWTRVLELAAVAAEILRARHGGRWVESDSADIPFGFQNDQLQVVLATNRAARFIADGEGESMFALIETDAEMRNRADGPILPSLRSRAEATRDKMLFRPLLEKIDDADVPVIAYGSDSPRTFGLLMNHRTDDRDELHRTALENLAGQEVETSEFELADVEMTAVSGSFFATEKVLDRAFMRGMHEVHGELLAVAVPRRGLMFVTNAAPEDPLRAMTVLRAIVEKESQTTRAIAPAILLVQDALVVGRVQLTPADGADSDEPEPPPAKKPGFFKRLFGGG